MGSEMCIRDRLKKAWEAMHAGGLLDGEIENQMHSMMDICTFYMNIYRCRNDAKKQISPSLRGVVDAARLPLLLWITAAVEGYVRRVYHADNPAVHSAPPALSHKTAGTRKYTVVFASAAWGLMEAARLARVNER